MRTYRTEIYIWSRNGHTPLTNRQGGFCDELLHTTLDLASPAEAEAETKRLIEATEHGSYGHFCVTGYPNQNTRSRFVGSAY